MNIETANRLLQYRKNSKLSQEELAQKIGVSRQAVSKWERAEASPDTDNLIMLAKVYSVSLDELLNLTPDKDTEVDTSKAESTETESTEPKEKNGDKVSFRDGIHVDAENGDKVDISFKGGIHVDSADGTHVHIGGGRVQVEDPNGNTHDYERPSWLTGLLYLPFPIIVTVWFLLWGFSGEFGGWGTSWMSLLTIPLFYSFIDAVKYKDAARFAFPVLAVIVFCTLGMFYGLWHPTWIVFLLIPVYYFICDAVKNARRSEDASEDTDKQTEE